jgi:CHASE3 domain sensor protein
VRLLVAVLVFLLVAFAAIATATGLRAGRVSEQVSDRLLPALAAVEQLQTAYRDQVNAQHSYVLSGQRSFLLPYEGAAPVIETARTEVRGLLADQPPALAMLDGIAQAHDQWLRESSRPVLALVAQGRSAEAMVLIAPGGLDFQLSTVVRDRLDQLWAITMDALATASAQATRAQREGLAAVGLALGLGLLVATLTLVDLHRSVTRPIADLIRCVAAVAGGALDRPVRSSGPAEITLIAQAVERMRQLLAAHAQHAVAAEHQTTKTGESERIGTDLRHQVVGRLSSTGISLTSLASRQPDVAEPLMAAVQELDEVTSQLRRAVFDLNCPDPGTRTVRQQVFDLIAEVERDLGFVPSVSIGTPVDTSVDPELTHEVLAATREALSALSSGHNPDDAAVRLAIIDTDLHLFVKYATEPPVGNGDQRWTQMTTRATRLGGTCTTHQDRDGNTVLDWTVPIPGAEASPPVLPNPFDASRPFAGVSGPDGR